MSVRGILGLNTKDAFGGTVSSAPTMFGHRRSIPVNNPVGRVAVACGLYLKGFATNLLFRRVRPVESRVYAFSRNFFALVAVGILVFRTISALLQAQNEIGTRMTSGTCFGRAPLSYDIGILMERVIIDSRWNASAPRGTAPVEPIDITVSASWRGARRGQEPLAPTNCTIQWSKDYGGGTYFGYQNRTAELYTCSAYWNYHPPSYFDTLRQFGDSDVLAYDIKVRPRTTGGRVLPQQMPQVWLLNAREIPFNLSSIDVEDFEIREYNPPWELLPGSHIDAEAKLITRRFISSSIMKDVVLNSEPASDAIDILIYRPLSLFPIVESSVIPLNSSNTSAATVTISASLAPGLMYLRTQTDVQKGYSDACDFIDDYRSGSVLDVVGSVGGLFALLQAIHLLLFGRPLFWGLTGESRAKLITPFGLLGKCSSRGFKRRLRDEYHTQNTEDGSDTIHIVKFLRDFVIEFGPADLEPERCSSQQLPQSEVKVDESDPQAALMQTDPVTMPVRHRDEDSGGHEERTRVRTNDVTLV